MMPSNNISQLTKNIRRISFQLNQMPAKDPRRKQLLVDLEKATAKLDKITRSATQKEERKLDQIMAKFDRSSALSDAAMGAFLGTGTSSPDDVDAYIARTVAETSKATPSTAKKVPDRQLRGADKPPPSDAELQARLNKLKGASAAPPPKTGDPTSPMVRHRHQRDRTSYARPRSASETLPMRKKDGPAPSHTSLQEAAPKSTGLWGLLKKVAQAMTNMVNSVNRGATRSSSKSKKSTHLNHQRRTSPQASIRAIRQASQIRRRAHKSVQQQTSTSHANWHKRSNPIGSAKSLLATAEKARKSVQTSRAQAVRNQSRMKIALASRRKKINELRDKIAKRDNAASRTRGNRP